MTRVIDPRARELGVLMPDHRPARVDIGALAGDLKDEAARRVAAILVRAGDELDRTGGLELNEAQKTEFLRCAFEELSSLELTIAKTLRDRL